MLIEQMAVLTTGLMFIMFFIIEWWRMWKIRLSSFTYTSKEHLMEKNMLKIFKDSYNNNKNFYHFNVLGFKFRVATNTRNLNKFNTYSTKRGRVLNIGKKYICFMPV